jgi:hypothetical protein
LTEEQPFVETLAHADLIRRDNPDRFRHPRDGDALVTMLKRKPEPAQDVPVDVMPKGRNFH